MMNIIFINFLIYGGFLRMKCNFKGQTLSLLGSAEAEQMLQRNVESAIRERNLKIALTPVYYGGRTYEVNYTAAELKRRLKKRGLWGKTLKAIRKAKSLPADVEIIFTW
jgi:hypothetical protein